jgi:hypothetical protein
MSFFVSVELTSSERHGELRFCAERRIGAALSVGYPLVSFLVMSVAAIFWFTEEYPSQAAVGIAIGAAINLAASPFTIALGRMNRTTTLSVTSQRLTASGRGVGSGTFRSSSVAVPVSEVRWIGYLPDASRGLYLSTGFLDNPCLLPGLSREQCRSVLDAILRRFPEMLPKIASGN